MTGARGPERGEAGDRAVIAVKLGGSLITDKSGDAAARDAVIERLATEVAEVVGSIDERVVLGHGSGSYGHPTAAEHGLRRGARTRDERLGLGATQDRAARLHRRVTGALRDAGVPAFSVSPSSAAVAEGGAVADFAAEALIRALEGGFLPVVYGDVMMDRARGCTIASTEAVLLHLVTVLEDGGWPVRRVVWLGTTDGVLGRDGRRIARIEPDESADGGGAPEAAGGSSATDVTGGMRHRVETALELASRGVGSWIGDGRPPGALRRALAGRPEGGTRVPPAE